MPKLLLLSNSTMPGTPFFTWPRAYVKKFLGEKPLELLFIPYAAVTFSYDEYAGNAKKVFLEMGYRVTSIHEVNNKTEAIENTHGIVVGGGNTFALLSKMYGQNLLAMVRDQVNNGIPYIGWSAGANLACPTLCTTNDMPIVQPPSFEALNLIPFQINPHYHELKFEGQGGETRKQRLEEFLQMNPHKKVIGLPEGMLLERNENHLLLRGTGTAKLFQAGFAIKEITPDSNLSDLL